MPDSVKVEELRKVWTVIARLDPSILSGSLGALAHLDDACQALDLPPPYADPLMNDGFRIPKEITPSFKNASHEILVELRRELYAGEMTEQIHVWAEKLMRYCEIYLPDLHNRALQKWGNDPAARLGMLHLTAFLLDAYFVYQDLRLLNTSLKLVDQTWNLKIKNVLRSLEKDGDDRLCALFQARINMQIAHAFLMLEKNASVTFEGRQNNV